MAFLDKMFLKKDDVNVDDLLNNLDTIEEEEDVDFYVKPLVLQSTQEIDTAIKELKNRNIVLMDIESLSKRNPQRAKQFINQSKMFIVDNGGDIALISKTKLLLVPSKVKILKRSA